MAKTLLTLLAVLALATVCQAQIPLTLTNPGFEDNNTGWAFEGTWASAGYFGSLPKGAAMYVGDTMSGTRYFNAYGTGSATQTLPGDLAVQAGTYTVAFPVVMQWSETPYEYQFTTSLMSGSTVLATSPVQSVSCVPQYPLPITSFVATFSGITAQTGPLGIRIDVMVGSTNASMGIDDVTMTFQADAPPIVLGDANDDGKVDFADYLILESSFGSTIEPAGSGADFDNTGTVDFADYLILEATFGSGTAVVPEPASLSLLTLAGLALLRRRC